MTEIENEEFFHIQILNQSGKEWFINENYLIGNKYNNYYQGVIKSIEIQKFYAPNELYIKKIADILKESERNVNTLEMILVDVRESFGQYLKWVQEEIFEGVRKEKFSNLPSRKKCLWVCKFEDLPKWFEIFEEHSLPMKILKIKATGIIHKADGGLIIPDSYSIQEFEKRAEKYWSGVINNNKEIEFLFDGQLEILDEYKTVGEIS